MACDHMLRKIRKANKAYDQLELKSFVNDRDPDNKCCNEHINNLKLNDEHTANNHNNAATVDYFIKPTVLQDDDENDDDDPLELVSVQNDFTLKNSFWFAIGALMQQGADLYPRVRISVI